MCRFGVPHLIITDNGIQFEGKFKNLCADLQITLAQSFVKTPQTNEQIKAMKKKILTTLKKKVSEAKVIGWRSCQEFVRLTNFAPYCNRRNCIFPYLWHGGSNSHQD